uniref:Origin recognition complex subunit 4 n=1 Tax=Magallana gigas TaxID=29159 RepID=K1QBQ5_MAGGI
MFLPNLCHTSYGGTCVNYYFNSCLSGSSYARTGCGFQEMCCIPPKFQLTPPIHAGQCGISTPVTTHQYKIVGGTRAQPGEFPWQVSMRSNGHHVCGGILIADQWVLTAAHCFNENKNPYAWTVVVGEHDRAVLEGHEILEKVDTLFVHSHYSPSRYYNDIAIVKLGNAVPAYTEFIRPVCLPSANDSYDGMICTTDDRIALTEITRQLKLENTLGDKVFVGNFLFNHKILICNKILWDQSSKPILFLLDEFDLFAHHKNQTLLYNLFDVAQSAQAPICVVGITCRLQLARDPTITDILRQQFEFTKDVRALQQLLAFEHLIHLELVRTVDGAGSRVQKEYRLMQMLIHPTQILDALQKYPQCPTDVRQWAASSLAT